MIESDVNRLWVTVSCFGEGNLFAVYPRLLNAMLESNQGIERGPPDFEVLLPSNAEWREKIYYQLVEQQRALIGLPQPDAFFDRPRSAGPWDTTVPHPPAKRLRGCDLGTGSLTSRESILSYTSPVTWNVSDISKAAGLLADPPHNVEFGDEQEMRRVYSLVYNVFRYKNILSQALQDVAFFYLFPELRKDVHLVWLLLYDLYHRRFTERDHADGSAQAADELFPPVGLLEPEAALWATRVRLAAAMSRLRIANSALKLSDMLPEHLRDERVVKAVQVAPVMCWVNRNKIGGKKTPDEVFEEIRKTLDLQVMPLGQKNPGPFDLRWDPLCPMFLSFHHTQRTLLAQSSYVRDNLLIMQNRSFCFGPAVFCKLLYQHNLVGSVVQTHISSPRATAYFATLLGQNDQIYSLLVFGAGNRKQEYESYFSALNIKNIMVFSQRLVDMDPTANILEQVCAVFVTPPNSYSAVNDPIDLVCSRGGDLAMLQILTDTADSVEGQKRVKSILEEQRLTLRYAMSQPQIQFVLYETHSQLRAENEDMAAQAIREVNRAAQYKHFELLGKHFHPMKNDPSTTSTLTEQEINNNELGAIKESTAAAPTSRVTQKEIEIDQKEADELSLNLTKEEVIGSIEIPATDSFEQCKLPDLCFNADKCLSLQEEGCFLALCQRKEVIRFDAKYMIKIAEARGLFGATNPESPKPKQKAPRSRRKESASDAVPVKRKRGTFEVDRIAAPTHAFIMRTCAHNKGMQNGDVPFKCCARHHHDEECCPKVSPVRQWWAETTRYLTRLKKALIKQKLVSNKAAILNVVNKEKINKDISNIDEILNRMEYRKGKAQIPPFPKLRLTRCPAKVERKPYPVYVKSVKLVPDEDDDEEDEDYFEQLLQNSM